MWIFNCSVSLTLHIQESTICMCIYFSVFKEILPFATTQVNLENIRLSEIGQRKEKKKHDLTFTWDLKKFKDIKTA